MDVPVKHAYIKGCLVLGGYIPAEKPLLNLLGICISGRRTMDRHFNYIYIHVAACLTISIYRKYSVIGNRIQICCKTSCGEHGVLSCDLNDV